MAIGAYTVALLTIPVAKKETIFMLEPLVAPLNTLTLPFGAALVIGGLLAAALVLLIIGLAVAVSRRKRNQSA